jgi:hypothetical protein
MAFLHVIVSVLPVMIRFDRPMATTGTGYRRTSADLLTGVGWRWVR